MYLNRNILKCWRILLMNRSNVSFFKTQSAIFDVFRPDSAVASEKVLKRPELSPYGKPSGIHCGVSRFYIYLSILPIYLYTWYRYFHIYCLSYFFLIYLLIKMKYMFLEGILSILTLRNYVVRLIILAIKHHEYSSINSSYLWVTNLSLFTGGQPK